MNELIQAVLIYACSLCCLTTIISVLLNLRHSVWTVTWILRQPRRCHHSDLLWRHSQLGRVQLAHSFQLELLWNLPQHQNQGHFSPREFPTSERAGQGTSACLVLPDAGLLWAPFVPEVPVVLAEAFLELH